MIYPVILCGGSGTRLWPLSRQSYPKQFANLMGGESLFQATIRRLSGEGFAAPLIVTHADFRFVVAEQLRALGVTPLAILIEPEGRNTAPAVLAAALYLQKTDATATMLIAPSDHAIENVHAFHNIAAKAEVAARTGQLVTIGITPDRPETGYGYLELSELPKPDEITAINLKQFIEKPVLDHAEAMLVAGNFLWNAGIFIFDLKTVLIAFEEHALNLMGSTIEAVENAVSDLDFIRLDPTAWQALPSISIDYAVMENADNLSVIPFAGGWSDLGGWDAVYRSNEPDQNGVVTLGKSTAIDCKDTFLRSESDDLELVGIGLENIITIAMPDAVLVVDMSRAQDVKKAVEYLTAKSAKQATQLPRDNRPWGWFETLALGPRFQVKRIHVTPNSSLSLQSHVHRSEHWVVVSGTAMVTIGEEEKLVRENQSVYIPLGEKHRLKNPGKVDLQIVEIQTGAYLGEDDIVRYEDIYARK